MQYVRYWIWQAKLLGERGSGEAALANWTEAIRLAPEETALFGARAAAYVAKRNNGSRLPSSETGLLHETQPIRSVG